MTHNIEWNQGVGYDGPGRGRPGKDRGMSDDVETVREGLSWHRIPDYGQALDRIAARLEATEAALRELQAMENEDCYRGTADGPCHGEQRRCRPCVLRAALAALDKETQG